MSNEIIEKIEPIEELDQGVKQEIVEPTKRVAPSSEHFLALMEKKSIPLPIELDQGAGAQSTLMDSLRDASSPVTSTSMSHKKLVTQTKEAIAKIEQIKETLEGQNIAIKGSAQTILQSKLTHINDSLRVTLARVGVELNPTTTEEKPLVNPVQRFLHFLGDGQDQLQRLGGELESMSARGKELTPVNMLAIQVKVGQIQQELELFSSLLNKTLESIKTIMNIQV